MRDFTSRHQVAIVFAEDELDLLKVLHAAVGRVVFGISE